MEKYKVSKATYSCKYNDYILLMNTFSKKLMFSKEYDSVNSIFQKLGNRNEIETDDVVFQNLLKNGFVVKESLDENVIAKKRYWDSVYDHRLGITLMPTEQCNCRCPYCYESFLKPKMSDETIDSFLLFLKKNLISYTGLNISWFGGEPLLALDVIEKISKVALEICHARRIVYDSSITTNGVLLTPDVVKRLLDCRISRFQITLDGPKETHDKTRVLRNGEGTFDKIISNLLEIRKIKTAAIKVNIRINITKESLEKLVEFIDFLHDMFGDDRRFSFYFRPIGDWNNNIEVDALKKCLLPSLRMVYEVLLKHDKKLNYGILYQAMLSSMCYANKRNHFVMGSDGTIYKCTVYFDKDENHVGKLLTEGRILWDEEKMAKWINNDFDDLECDNCFMEATCHGKGCPAKTLIYGKKGGCGHEMENVENILKLLFQSNSYHHFYEKLEVK